MEVYMSYADVKSFKPYYHIMLFAHGFESIDFEAHEVDEIQSTVAGIVQNYRIAREEWIAGKIFDIDTNELVGTVVYPTGKVLDMAGNPVKYGWKMIRDLD
jgi:hypothetical protein